VLDAIIRRMLSLKPQERESAAEVAEALEREAEQGGPELDEPLFEWEELKRAEWPAEEQALAEELGHRPRRRSREVARKAAEADAGKRAEAERPKAEARPQAAVGAEREVPRERSRPGLRWLAAAMVGALVLWPEDQGCLSTGQEPLVTQRPSTEAQRDGGPSYVGDTALASAHSAAEAPGGEAVALELPPQPLPGQLKPDGNGRCRKGQYAINGGCWLKAELGDLEDCQGMRNVYTFRQGCYTPIFPPAREPTSTPIKPVEPER
jgi:hypothetical protein